MVVSVLGVVVGKKNFLGLETCLRLEPRFLVPGVGIDGAGGRCWQPLAVVVPVPVPYTSSSCK